MRDENSHETVFVVQIFWKETDKNRNKCTADKESSWRDFQKKLVSLELSVSSLIYIIRHQKKAKS